MNSITEQLVAGMGVDVRGSFLNSRERNQTLSKLRPLPFETNGDVSVATAQADSAENWNAAAILCGDCD